MTASKKKKKKKKKIRRIKIIFAIKQFQTMPSLHLRKNSKKKKKYYFAFFKLNL